MLNVRAGHIVVHLLLSIAMSFALLFVGFRLFYDSVIPEVFGLVLAGFCLAVARPRLWWVSILGLCAGIALSELGFPATAPAEHVARYGPPGPHSIAGLFLIFAFPTVGTLIGLVARFVFMGAL
jgi:hypothetical protein